MVRAHRKFYTTSQEAWEGLNEWLFLKEKKLTKMGQGKQGNISLAYDTWVYISRAWVDPEFDFAQVLGHRLQKWTSLVNNYVDMNYLDMVKCDIEARENKKQTNYNVAMHFTNSHNSGKDCLISLTFSRRTDTTAPVLTFHVRASEITKRLLWDFLLVQRIGEYVYGRKQEFSIISYIPMMFINAETFTMYDIHKPIEKLGKKIKGEIQPLQSKILELTKKFKYIDPNEITYKSHQRAVRQLQKGKDGKALSGPFEMKAKFLGLKKNNIEFPEDIITDRQRREYMKKIKVK